ncbi:SCO family protein [Flavobacterium sp. RHBU_24]|uniref:SCO family protein n=1 Tax=Flavobacterium sp. RHBU_24 TaxID=3391185 RepID=UPI003984A33E
MLSFLKKYRIIISVFIILSSIILTLFYIALSPKKTLKIYSPADVNPELADSTIAAVAHHHSIAPFRFVNQNGQTVTNKDYEGKIYVADFFFTTCQTICPIMTNNMGWLQDKVKDMDDVKLLSHSVTPETDSVPVLRAYADLKGATDGKWNMVTGNKRDIYYIARKSYLAVKTKKSSQLYDMVHTENFILVDKKGRIRGFYDGTNLDGPTEKGVKNVAQLLEDIKWLRENE